MNNNLTGTNENTNKAVELCRNTEIHHENEIETERNKQKPHLFRLALEVRCSGETLANTHIIRKNGEKDILELWNNLSEDHGLLMLLQTIRVMLRLLEPIHQRQIETHPTEQSRTYRPLLPVQTSKRNSWSLRGVLECFSTRGTST